MQRLSVLIVDNSTDLRKELESVLMDLDPLHARRSARTPEEAISIGRAFRPDVIIYDLPLAGADDARVIAELKAILPEARLLAISLYDHYGEAVRRAGADEFVLKTASRSVFLSALSRQCQGVSRQSE